MENDGMTNNEYKTVLLCIIKLLESQDKEEVINFLKEFVSTL